MRRILYILYVLHVISHFSFSFKFDTLARAHNRTVLDTQLEGLVQTSVEWLSARALQLDYPKLTDYTDQLQRVLRPSCKQCIDYYEAVATLRSLGKLVKQIVQDDRDDVLYPVVRRSYVAVVWMMQRSRLFRWQTSQLSNNVFSTLFRLYAHHTNRAKGRAVSFHHISKCGGTTMCQLAHSNKCSNPSMDQEKNCVLDSRLDGPVWMVAHDVTPGGAFPNATFGRLDAAAAPTPWLNMTNEQRQLARKISVEPQLPMWLMYTCPYAPIGRPNTCASRSQQVQDTRSTFLANERSLSRLHGSTQVCPQFINAIILREPVPHVVSLLAEVKFRYVRQLVLHHNITSWQPPGWNLTWWESLGPALVGNYATRTLVGRESFCRSAGNITNTQLTRAVHALIAFDMVMTLDRAKDIDLMVSTMLGWPAMQFSKQPASRVREMKPSAAAATSAVANNASGNDEWPPIGSFDDLRQYSIYLPNAVQPSLQPAAAVAGLGGSAAAAAGQGGHTTARRQDDAVIAAFGPQSSEFVTHGVYRRRRVLLADDAPLAAAAADSAGLPLAEKAPANHVAAAGAAVAMGENRVLDQLPQQLRQEQQQTPGLQSPLLIQQQEQQQQQHVNTAVALSREYVHEHEEFGQFSEHNWDDADDDDGDYSEDVTSDEALEQAAAALYAVISPPPPPPPPPAQVPKPVLEASAAVKLVKRFWLERQVQRMGYATITAAGGNIPPPPEVTHLQHHDRHGAHLVTVVLPAGVPASAASPREEVWHAFPKHNIAFTASDMWRLERLTALDSQLVQTADLLLDLDTVWLQSLMHSHHYRKRMKSVATTYTACGFSGMMSLTNTVQDYVFQPEGLMRTDRQTSKAWSS